MTAQSESFIEPLAKNDGAIGHRHATALAGGNGARRAFRSARHLAELRFGDFQQVGSERLPCLRRRFVRSIGPICGGLNSEFPFASMSSRFRSFSSVTVELDREFCK